MTLIFNDKPYFAIIGDIFDSKRINERGAVQAQLAAVLDGINKTYQSDIAANFMITLGDEFQGLLQTGQNAMAIISQIEREMHPTRLRFGLGAGGITTAINHDMPLGADGPAYYNARTMINELKQSENKSMAAKLTIKIGIENNHEVSDLINSIFALSFAIKNQWTNRQREIVETYLRCGTQSNAAKCLGINQSNVHKALAATDFYALQKAMDTINEVFSEIRS